MVESNNIPEDFLCPINQEIMEDPVVAADGHTYERDAITRWLQRNTTSPITGKKLKHSDLVENHRLRSAISQYLNRIRQTISSEEDEEANAISSIQDAISKKKDYIDRIRMTIIYLTDIKEDLAKDLLHCKVSNTVGNSVTLASTPLFFTPAFVVGIIGAIGGGITSLGTTVTQHFIEKSKLKQMKEILIEEEKAAIRYQASEFKAHYILETTNIMNATKVAIISTKPVANVVSGGSGASKVLTLGKLSKLCVIAGVAISTLDIVLTWTMDNSTLELIKKEIGSREILIDEQIKELEDMEKA